jgi:hypothetical protein
MTGKRVLESAFSAAIVMFGVAAILSSIGCDPSHSCIPDGWEEHHEQYKLALPALGIELKARNIHWLIGDHSVDHTFDIDNRGNVPVVLERAELMMKSHTYDAHVGEATGELPTLGPGWSRSIYLVWHLDQPLYKVFDRHPRFVLHFRVEFKRSVVEVPYTCSR